MIRLFAAACTLFAFVLLVGDSTVDAQKAQKTQKTPMGQMVRGTIKLVDTSKDLLVINQKVKNETVDRELSILDTTEFAVTIKGEKKTALGAAGLQLLENAKGAMVNVKCDKDVNVLKVTATVK